VREPGGFGGRSKAGIIESGRALARLPPLRLLLLLAKGGGARDTRQHHIRRGARASANCNLCQRRARGRRDNCGRHWVVIAAGRRGRGDGSGIISARRKLRRSGVRRRHRI
jgi:hypothetical protein